MAGNKSRRPLGNFREIDVTLTDYKATPIADALAEGQQAYRDDISSDEPPEQYEVLTPQFLAWVVGWSLERESDGVPKA
jgi:hypothetical protein